MLCLVGVGSIGGCTVAQQVVHWHTVHAGPEQLAGVADTAQAASPSRRLAAAAGFTVAGTMVDVDDPDWNAFDPDLGMVPDLCSNLAACGNKAIGPLVSCL